MKTANQTIRLLCLDFDGTAVGYDQDQVFLAEPVLDFLNTSMGNGLGWCTNSGRTLESQLEVLEASRARGLRHFPEALMCGESFLYERSGESYRPHERWNDRAFAVLSEFHRDLQSRIEPELRKLAQEYGVSDVIFEDAATAYLVPTDDQAVLKTCFQRLEKLVQDTPRGYASRNGGWIFVGHRDFGKGRVLQAYMTERGLSSNEVIAVGDNLNDVDMLDGSVSHHVGCPGNALPEVIQVVRKANGFVSEDHGPAGTLDVIRHFLARV